MAGNVIETGVEGRDKESRAGWITKDLKGLFDYIFDITNSFDVVNARTLSTSTNSGQSKLKLWSYEQIILFSYSFEYNVRWHTWILLIESGQWRRQNWWCCMVRALRQVAALSRGKSDAGVRPAWRVHQEGYWQFGAWDASDLVFNYPEESLSLFTGNDTKTICSGTIKKGLGVRRTAVSESSKRRGR